jgi:hypothetical protein
VIVVLGLAGLGLVAIAWVIRRILLHFNDRLDTLEGQMNVLLPPTR